MKGATTSMQSCRQSVQPDETTWREGIGTFRQLLLGLWLLPARPRSVNARRLTRSDIVSGS